jgi:lysine 6-dehydrogenase
MGHYLVLGAGKMGVVLAKDLIDSDAKNRVILVDYDKKQLKTASDFIQNKRLSTIQADVENKRQRDNVFKGQDVALSALLHKHSLLAMEAALQAGMHFVDLAGEFTPERQEYDGQAKRKGITLLSGVGVSPGITNVCVGRGVHLLDTTEKALIYVGGIPVHPKPPLKYRIVYAVNSLLGLYQRQVPIIRDGRTKMVPALSGVESVSFDPPFSEMECFFSDGLNSLIHTMKGKVKKELWEKTLRHQGHSQEIKTLKDCGLFSTRPIRVSGQEVVPREILEILLDSRIKLGKEKDATLLRVLVTGKKSGKAQTHVFEMVDHYDTQKSYTSMAKTTSFPASIAAQMIVSGDIRRRGCQFPEGVFHSRLYEPFMEELKRRGVLVTHKVQ